jgi:hypothetical protein
MSVANVADIALNSSLVLDYITAGRVCITPLEASPSNGGAALPFATAAAHCYIDAVATARKFDPDGVGEEPAPSGTGSSPAPGAPPKMCREIVGAGAKDVLAAAYGVKRHYQPCQSGESWTRYFCKAPRLVGFVFTLFFGVYTCGR